MAEQEIKLTGWQAMVGIAVLLGIIIFRFMTLGDGISDEKLRNELTIQLQSDYFPGQVEALRAAVESGDDREISEVAESILGSQLRIQSIKGSYPLFNFSSSKNVIVKVEYYVGPDAGSSSKQVKYFLYRHGAIGNSWQYQRESSVVSYYLNFF